MGVTVHFEGRLQGEAALKEAIALAQDFADTQGWSTQIIDEAEVTLNRVKNEEVSDYTGPVKGIEIQPHENSDPLRLEFDSEFYIQEYIKTQFAPIAIHQAVVKLLKLLRPYFVDLDVEDEGEYFATDDLALLQTHIDRCNEVLDEYLAEPDRYYGPVRLGNGRIVDLMERD